MSGSGIFLDYVGFVDHEKINILLKKLKKSEEFLSLDRTTGRRLYGVVVECLDNISRYSVKNPSDNQAFQPYISAFKQNNRILIKTGNTVSENKTASLTCRLCEINQMEDEALTEFYEKMINKESVHEGKGAGLGFVFMKLKSGNNIAHSFTIIDKQYSFFEINISVNKYIMRKLILEKTASSPKVILDPDKRVFEISGESRPPDPAAFYGELITWLDDYSKHILKSQESIDPDIFIFDLAYFNSSSARYILDFCKILTVSKSEDNRIEVRWKYDNNDLDMLESGRELSRLAKLPFEFVGKDNG